MKQGTKIFILIGSAVLALGAYFLIVPMFQDAEHVPVVNDNQPEGTLTQAEQDELLRQLLNSPTYNPPAPKTLSSEESVQLKKDMTATGPSSMSESDRKKLLEQMSAQ